MSIANFNVRSIPGLCLLDPKTGILFDHTQVFPFIPFSHGSAVFGGLFGDEGKGKTVDEIAKSYKDMGLKVLSTRGNGSGNAGHTVVNDGVEYHFHYLTSAGLVADLILLGPCMLIDPKRLLAEAQTLPKEKQEIIMVAERATIVTDLDRLMDAWYENQKVASGHKPIGTTKSGVGPGTANRANRTHVTFADALMCKDYKELKEKLLQNPDWPSEIRAHLTDEYASELFDAIKALNIVDSVSVISKCRNEGNWAILLEVSQAVCLDNLFGNGGHFTTSMSCTDIGGAAGAGLTMYDFPDGSTMVLKAYSSKVGEGPFVTRFTPEEQHIDTFIDSIVHERGVTTGRKRDLGWFDATAVRNSIKLTNADICINCIDVIPRLAEVTDTVKVCFAYEVHENGKTSVTYDWKYNLKDCTPLYSTLDIRGKSEKQIIQEYILLIEMIIGKKIKGYGVGPSREDYRLREEAFK